MMPATAMPLAMCNVNERVLHAPCKMAVGALTGYHVTFEPSDAGWNVFHGRPYDSRVSG